MNQALQIGPLSLPYSLLLTLLAITLGGFVARRLARSAGTEVEPTLTHMLLVGLVAARLAFVWQWREQYLKLPLSILDIRDGGWEPWAGLGAALLYCTVLWLRRSPWRRPATAGLATFTAVWLAGLGALIIVVQMLWISYGVFMRYGWPGIQFDGNPLTPRKVH